MKLLSGRVRVLVAALVALFVGVSVGLTPAFAAPVDGAPPEAATTAQSRTVNQLNFDFDRHGLPDRMHGGNILHAWNMSFNEIRARLPYIAQAGFGVIQTSPIGDSVFQFPAYDPQVAHLAGYVGPWWMLYQPRSFNIGNLLGTEDDFRALTREAAEHGIHVIVDAIPNHLTTWWNGIDEYLRRPEITWQHANYPGGAGVPGSGSWYDRDIHNFSNRYSATRQRLVGLVDMDTTNPWVQQTYMDFLGRKIDAGASGFRYDAVLHIELPCPHDPAYMCSDFWPNILDFADERIRGTHGVEPLQYGELLHNIHNLYLNALPNMMLTADGYGHMIRNDFLHGRLGGWDTHWGNNVALHNGHRMVQWVESHDNYGNAGTSRWINDDQMRVGWSLIAARADSTPLFLVRPGDGFVNNGQMFSYNGDGTFRNNWGHRDMYRDATVQAVNWFSNDFLGQPERTSTHGSVALIERGPTTTQTHGVTIVNSGNSSVGVSFPVNMVPGVYVDQVTGAEFTVANGRITGPDLGARSVAVIYNRDVTPPAMPAVSATPGTSSFTDPAGVTVTLTALHTTEQYFTVYRNDELVTEATPFAHGDEIVIGAGAEVGDEFVLTITGTDGETTDTQSFRYVKADPLAGTRVEFTHPEWDTARIWAYHPGGGNVFDNWNTAPLMERETVDGTDVWTFTLAPDVELPLYVMFHNGAGAQTRSTLITGPSRITHTGDVSAIIPPLRPVVFATPGSSNFGTAAGIEVTLRSLRTTESNWSLSGPETVNPTPFEDGDTITIGVGSMPGEVFTLTLTGTDGTHTDTREFEFVHVDPDAPVRVEFTQPDWEQARIWAWNTDGNLSGGDWANAPLMSRETVDGQDVWVHYFAAGTTLPMNVIVHNGLGEQSPEARIAGSSRISSTGEVTPILPAIGTSRLYTTPGSGEFTGTDGITVTLGAQYMRNQQHRIQGMPFPTEFEPGETLTIGRDLPIGGSVYVDLSGNALDGSGFITERFTFTRVADEVPGDDVPGDVPGDDAPGDDVPGDDVPGDDLPGDDVPGDDLPGDVPGDGPLLGDIEVTFDVDAADGGLSLQFTDLQVHLGTARLTPEIDALVAEGRLPRVRVTDTRVGNVGWSLAGVASPFRTADGTESAASLGWRPHVLDLTPGKVVQAGPEVAATTGLTGGATKAHTRPGDGLGTVDLDAALRVQAPTDTPAGTLTAQVTLTLS